MLCSETNARWMHFLPVTLRSFTSASSPIDHWSAIILLPNSPTTSSSSSSYSSCQFTPLPISSLTAFDRPPFETDCFTSVNVSFPFMLYNHFTPPAIALFLLVLATGPGNPPAVRVRTGKTVRIGSRTVQKPDQQHLGGPNPDPYPSTRGFCRVWLDPSVPISGSAFQVFLFMVAFRYPTVNRKIFTLAHHWPFWMNWPPF